jgi:hypothetical protein
MIYMTAKARPLHKRDLPLLFGLLPSAFLNGLLEKKLDLPIHAPEFVLGPTLELAPELRIHPQ